MGILLPELSAHAVLGARKDIHELIQQTSIKICSGSGVILDAEDVDTGLVPWSLQ